MSVELQGTRSCLICSRADRHHSFRLPAPCAAKTQLALRRALPSLTGACLTKACETQFLPWSDLAEVEVLFCRVL
ncbi:hypothetical protein ABE44_10325, partial [Bacillus thuringiensis]|nr:hypothetical protein [Bacillus thuringiensis]